MHPNEVLKYEQNVTHRIEKTKILYPTINDLLISEYIYVTKTEEGEIKKRKKGKTHITNSQTLINKGIHKSNFLQIKRLC